MATISIKYNSEGRIVNRFIGTKQNDEWTLIKKSDWPEVDPAEDEIEQFYYDESTDEITVEYKTVTIPDEVDGE